MHLMYFTEQPMSAYSEQAGRDFGATALMFPNSNFDPVAGSRLYNNYIEQYMLAEEVGVDGIMLNEHHNAPFCMQAKANMFAAILAAVTKKVKIVMLGNPLPLAENPVRLAEELAMIDMISKGRTGFSARRTGFSARGSGLPRMTIFTRSVTAARMDAMTLVFACMQNGALWCSFSMMPSMPTASASLYCSMNSL